MNQHPGGYNPGYGAPPSSQAQPGFGGPTQQGPPGQIGSGPPPQNMSNGPNQRPIGPPGQLKFRCHTHDCILNVDFK